MLYHYKPKTVNKDVEDIYDKLTNELAAMQEKVMIRKHSIRKIAKSKKNGHLLLTQNCRS